MLTQATILLDVYEDPINHTITSYLVENSSAFLRTYEGRWRLFAEEKEEEGAQPGTLMCYEALVRPKDLIPIMAVEWKMKRDLAANLSALKRVAEEEGGEGEVEMEKGEEEEAFWDCVEEEEEEVKEEGGREEFQVSKSLGWTTIRRSSPFSSSSTSSFSFLPRQCPQKEEARSTLCLPSQQQGRRTTIMSSFSSFRRVAVALPRFGGKGTGEGTGGWVMRRRRRKTVLIEGELSQ
eukprot:evm.model.NODE_26802_length_6943_cov_39.030392.1